jgi:Rho termination factor, N-terminal domain
MKLIALKTFSAGGASLTEQGTVFEASQAHAHEYISLGLAEEYHETEAPKTIEGERSQVTDPTIETAQTDYTEGELQEMTVLQLRGVAKNIGVTGYSNLSKSELIFAILAQQKANQAK